MAITIHTTITDNGPSYELRVSVGPSGQDLAGWDRVAAVAAPIVRPGAYDTVYKLTVFQVCDVDDEVAPITSELLLTRTDALGGATEWALTQEVVLETWRQGAGLLAYWDSINAAYREG